MCVDSRKLDTSLVWLTRGWLCERAVRHAGAPVLDVATAVAFTCAVKTVCRLHIVSVENGQSHNSVAAPYPGHIIFRLKKCRPDLQPLPLVLEVITA